MDLSPHVDALRNLSLDRGRLTPDMDPEMFERLLLEEQSPHNEGFRALWGADGGRTIGAA